MNVHEVLSVAKDLLETNRATLATDLIRELLVDCDRHLAVLELPPTVATEPTDSGNPPSVAVRIR